jgi:hypothetical protein
MVGHRAGARAKQTGQEMLATHAQALLPLGSGLVISGTAGGLYRGNYCWKSARRTESPLQQ